MKIEMNKAEEMTLEEFADKYGLILEINDRGTKAKKRYYAQFKHSWISEGFLPHSGYADGDTPQQAMIDYMHNISEQTLAVYDEDHTNRRDIPVPILRMKK